MSNDDFVQANEELVAAFGVVESKSKAKSTKIFLVQGQVGLSQEPRLSTVQRRNFGSREVEVDRREHYNFDVFTYVPENLDFEQLVEVIKTSFQVSPAMCIAYTNVSMRLHQKQMALLVLDDCLLCF